MINLSQVKLTALVILPAFAILIATLNASAAKPSCPGSPGKKAAITQIAPGVYVRLGVQEIMSKENLAGIANISFVVGGSSIAVIDTGGSYCDGLKFKAAIRAVSNLPISHVINTHSHPDHVFGNAAFEGKGVVFVGHKKLKRAIAERGPLYLENLKRLLGDEAMQGVKVIGPAESVETTKTIDLGGRKLTLTAPPNRTH